MRMFGLFTLMMAALLLSGCSGSQTGENDCPEGQVRGEDGECHPKSEVDGDTPEGEIDEPLDGDLINPDGDPDGDVIVDGDIDIDLIDKPVDGDLTEDGDKDLETPPDGDQTDGDVVDGDEPDGDVVIDGDIDFDFEKTDGQTPYECGAECTVNEDCVIGCYCDTDLAVPACAKDCDSDTEFLCGALDCDFLNGKCVDPNADGDVDDNTPTRCDFVDEDCRQWWRCNSLGWCEPGRCDDSGTKDCDEGYYCTDHGRCRIIPEADDAEDTRRSPHPDACESREDCRKGYLCDWESFLCVPGCRVNGDCLPESPNCIEGICY